MLGMLMMVLLLMCMLVLLLLLLLLLLMLLLLLLIERLLLWLLVLLLLLLLVECLLHGALKFLAPECEVALCDGVLLGRHVARHLPSRLAHYHSRRHL